MKEQKWLRTFDKTLLEPRDNNWDFKIYSLINHKMINDQVKGHLITVGLQMSGPEVAQSKRTESGLNEGPIRSDRPIYPRKPDRT